jgi:exosortase
MLAVLYGSVLKNLILDWWSNAEHSHGFLVPLFSAYVLWRERRRYLTLEAAPSRLGMAVMLAATALLVVGRAGAEYFTSRLSLPVMLAGIVLFLAGWEILRAVLFPLAFLLVAIPMPVLIQNQITFPLQLLASRFASRVLELLATPVVREGNVLYLSRSALEVAEACSGIRFLTALIGLALVFGYLAGSAMWIRAVLVMSMVPLAVVSNGLRVVVTGLMSQAYGQQWTEGARHEALGLLVFLVPLLFLAGAQSLLSRLSRGRAQHAVS